MDDPLLTLADIKPLLALVRFQQQKNKKVDFTIPLGALAINFENEFYLTPPRHSRELWQQQGYIVITAGKMYTPAPPEEPPDDTWEDEEDIITPAYFERDAMILTLTQKAIAYERWLTRPT